EAGEGWASRDIRNNTPLIDNLNNLHVSPAGPDPVIVLNASGNALNVRKVELNVNGNQLFSETMNLFNTLSKQVSFPLSYLGRPVDTIRIVNNTTNANDRMVVAKYEMTYPRLFKFVNALLFEFKLPASASGNFLDISGFNHGNTAPVLYDLTNGKRYLGNIAVAGKTRFALPAAGERQLVLMNVEVSNINLINSLTQRNFINYANNPGTFLIISNPVLYNGANGNPVEAYRLYRSSAEGGNYQARVYDIDQLV